MKFWKILSNLIEQTLPNWPDKFLSYKDLKKQLKLICPKDGDVEIDKFNSFFVEKEEEYVIKLKELQDRVSRAKDSNEELVTVGSCTELHRSCKIEFLGLRIRMKNW
ncbi:hypothetical protein K1719_022241 [Acacia pycnantha]|nr:hypothetical protein K1719_022241 [Acacia pycnantha]